MQKQILSIENLLYCPKCSTFAADLVLQEMRLNAAYLKIALLAGIIACQGIGFVAYASTSKPHTSAVSVVVWCGVVWCGDNEVVGRDKNGKY